MPNAPHLCVYLCVHAGAFVCPNPTNSFETESLNEPEVQSFRTIPVASKPQWSSVYVLIHNSGPASPVGAGIWTRVLMFRYQMFLLLPSPPLSFKTLLLVFCLQQFSTSMEGHAPTLLLFLGFQAYKVHPFNPDLLYSIHLSVFSFNISTYQKRLALLSRQSHDHWLLMLPSVSFHQPPPPPSIWLLSSFFLFW